MKSIFLLSTVLLLCSCISPNPQLDLSGKWQFQTDPEDIGVEENWYNSDFNDELNLPGSMAENGKGNAVTLETNWTGGVKNEEWYNDPNYAPYFDANNVRFPYWLQPEKKYTGAAWYRKKVELDENWQGKNVWLHVERPHWESSVWVNGKFMGTKNSLATPHLYQITEAVEQGMNEISIRIDNRIKEVDPGINSHSITDHTQSNWNGMVGEIGLISKDNIYFDNVKITPNIDKKEVEIEAVVINSTAENKKIKIEATAEPKYNTPEGKLENRENEYLVSPGENNIQFTYPLGDNAKLWDEFNPNVYELALKLISENGTDSKTVDFGLREFKANGTRLEINDRPVFLRGTLECAIFPETGYPPTNTVGWEKVFRAVKNHGLNHVRFHSWCPPEAAFEAADKMGIYLQVECSSWANQSTQLGSGFPIDQYIWDESKRIVKEYGNHPSFVMMAYGNEPGGPQHIEYLKKFVNYWKEKDNRRIYTAGAGWPVIEENEFHCTHKNVRIQGWGEELKSIINSQPPRTNYDWTEGIKGMNSPLVSHEIGQWCVYPNFKEMEKYTGVLKPKNFEIFRESLNAHHMGHLADSFLLASGNLQALCYKADIEAALRTPGFGGFQLLDLHDFPGQGTALVGVLDPFWEEKGYISPEEYRRFCNVTVPLARMKKRIFTEGEEINIQVEAAHFGSKPLENVNPKWEITSSGKTVAEGTLGQRPIPIGNGISLGEINYSFPRENTPRKLTVEVEIDTFSNSWDVWVFPENVAVNSDEIKVVENISPSTLNYLKNGGNVLLSLGKGKVAPEMGGEVGVGFSSIFWNTAWTNGQKPHTLGILCDPNHPALELFPTEYHSNWQWWDAMSHSDAIQLDSFPVELKPIVRIIDDWVSNRRLALIFEAKVGNGSLVVCGADLNNNLKNRPEARQLRSSLINYMASPKFKPKAQLTANQIQKIVN